MIIDAHTHMLHRDYFDKLAEKGGKWGEKTVASALAQITKTPALTDIPTRIAMLDRNGIARQVVTPRRTFDSNLLPGDIAAQLAYARVLNDSMAQLTEDSKGRLVATGNVPLADFERYGRQEMERAVKVLGLKALVVSSNIAGKPIDLPEHEAFWAYAAETGVPVYIHPDNAISTEGRCYEADYDLMHCFGWPFETELALSRLVFSGIMERYPTLKVVSHHLGGGIPFFWGRIQETYTNFNQKFGTELPKPLFDYFSRFYYDTAIGGNPHAVRCTYELFGVDQLLFATDAPFGPKAGEERLATYPRMIESMGLSNEENRKIFETNAKRVLGLD